MRRSSVLAEIPPLVQQALRASERVGFDGSCDVPFGLVLHTLVAVYPEGRFCEIGTGCGVGAAWMVTNMWAGSRLYTVDYSLSRVKIARELLRNYSAVQVLHADWREVLAHGPFDLVFVDVAEAKAVGLDDIVAVTRIGGMILVDDVYPDGVPAPEWRAHVDPIVRERFLNDSGLSAVELALTPQESMILATKKSAPASDWLAPHGGIS